MELMRKQVLAFILFLLLTVSGVIAVLVYSDVREEGFSYTAEDAVGGGEFLSQESIENWLNYNGEADVEELTGFTPEVEPLNGSELKSLQSILKNGSYEGSYGEGAYGEGAPNTPALEENDGEERAGLGGEKSAADRAVEEGDIVKLSGDHLYILSYFRGFVVVDVSDPQNLRLISTLNLKGYPVEMYVHEPLAVVVLSGYFPLPRSGALSPSTLVAVLDLRDISRVRVIKYITVEGVASVSRLVGDTLYMATLKHPYSPYYYQEGGAGVKGGEGVVVGDAEAEVDLEPRSEVVITSINLASPQKLGVSDSLSLKGDSVQVHATSTAIFVATTSLAWNREEYEETTTLHYVDISDPSGKIRLGGSVTFNGALWDKYQMDYYRGTLRVITHINDWREQGSSFLWIIDVRRPGKLRVLGSLSVDEAGNLMAVRFDRTRLYLIHLPYAPDPLRVVDLSDPTSPKLCSVLEIPGWVEHMEVMGNTIVAVGVNNTGGFRVSVYLFDVKDPYNPILKDRISIGEYSSSEALWEPKAVTLLQERSLLIIPFEDYSAGWRGRYGLLFIKYTSEDLSLWGEVNSPEILRRSRVKGDYVLGTSEKLCMSVEVAGEHPKLSDILPLTENYRQLVELPEGTGALVEVLGEERFRYIPPDGDVVDVSLPREFSTPGWTRAFSWGWNVLIVHTPYYYVFYGDGDGSDHQNLTLLLIKIEGGRPAIGDVLEIPGVYSPQTTQLSGGRLALKGEYYNRYYEIEDEDVDESSRGEGGALSAENGHVYIVNYSGAQLSVEEFSFEGIESCTLFSLGENLYASETSWDGSGTVTKIYYLDLESEERRFVGELSGWQVTQGGDRVVTEVWRDGSYSVNVYRLRPWSVEKIFSKQIDLWGNFMLKNNSLYVASYFYYPVYKRYGPEVGWEEAGTVVMRIDLKEEGVAEAVRINGSFYAVRVSGDYLVLSGNYMGSSMVCVLDSENLTRVGFYAIPASPLDVAFDGGILHIAMGEFGYTFIPLE